MIVVLDGNTLVIGATGEDGSASAGVWVIRGAIDDCL